MLAEQLLARACENEADNAKRMRMGMEPVSQVNKMMMAVTRKVLTADDNDEKYGEKENMIIMLMMVMTRMIVKMTIGVEW